jgi:hypothetical protein
MKATTHSGIAEGQKNHDILLLSPYTSFQVKISTLDKNLIGKELLDVLRCLCADWYEKSN